MKHAWLGYAASLALHGALSVSAAGIEAPRAPQPPPVRIELQEVPEPPPPNDPPPAPDPAPADGDVSSEASPTPTPAPPAPNQARAPQAPPPAADAPAPAAAPVALGITLGNGTGPGGLAVSEGSPSGTPTGTPAPTSTRTRGPRTLTHATDAPTGKPCAGESKRARPLGIPRPAYPEAARAAGISGRVRVEVTIGTDGSVQGARVLSGLGHGLDQAALGAAQSARFEPALECGRPVRSTLTIGIRFNL